MLHILHKISADIEVPHMDLPMQKSQSMIRGIRVMYFEKGYHNENKVSAGINMSILTIYHLMDKMFSVTHTFAILYIFTQNIS
jgi:hypothetical protein